MLKKINERPYVWTMMLGAGLFYWLYDGYNAPMVEHFDPKETLEYPSVSIERLKSDLYQQRLPITAKLEPIHSYAIQAQAQGSIKTLFVREGSRVIPGQIIAQLDDDVARASFRLAEADRIEQERQFKNAEQLHQSGAISQNRFDEIKAKYESALLSRDRAREQLETFTVTAIHTGIIHNLNVEEGESVGPNTVLASLVDDSGIKTTLKVPEHYLHQIDAKAPVEIALEGKTITGEIQRIGSIVDSRTHTFEVDVYLDNKEEKMLVPGMTTKADILLLPMKVIAVPSYVIEIDDNNQYAMDIVTGGVIQSVPVRLISFRTDGRVNVALEHEQVDVVVLGGLYVENGDKVIVREAQ